MSKGSRATLTGFLPVLWDLNQPVTKVEWNCWVKDFGFACHLTVEHLDQRLSPMTTVLSSEDETVS